ncbi:MAG: aminodeoxychorismate/anthranilate synthase component II [Flavobacteriia bacterium]|nr:MAG: aminodeoxychorismate/anthranilate synthase component II [Flavobacteriia bacterium]
MTQKILLIDNYDSFTYNLVHYIEALDYHVDIYRNDALGTIDINKYQKVIISPGPGLPDESGDLMDFLQRHQQTKSILGICLGQQAIAQLFGGQLKALPHVKHGISETITHMSNDCIYKDIPETFEVGLYYSWYVTQLPESIVVTAQSEEGIPMSIKHNQYDISAVQYHPESIMTPLGKQILKNWLHHADQ